MFQLGKRVEMLTVQELVHTRQPIRMIANALAASIGRQLKLKNFA